uniref:Uncharacterized protein n=1 Tax=Anguilla anguilla TaxID=7936 RepID=A0A0E9VJR4_ANGAN
MVTALLYISQPTEEAGFRTVLGPSRIIFTITRV